ncbi:helix-turn-helix transcriptional regulator [Mucilaginibacter sp. BT774]|uniref:helix-turn-helix domain-containing protein n=1 Tax=Mucilaginibacter sp. BT774 TaxID=3062276 RepID=UPI002674B6D3|nr:helix-turn-helix transcriptional regulator [Mucilaginibacter sp. BT774]MDO3627119.1 helix-turn-helix transcriptional regulator [Mucilaginibacter sp. BT774]
MTSREKLLSRPTYWFDHAQNEIFRQFYAYMDTNKINQTKLSEKLGISKSRVSQILNGDLNCTLKKLFDVSLAIGIVPQIEYKSIEQVLIEDKLLQEFYGQSNDAEKKTAALTNYSSFIPPITNDRVVQTWTTTSGGGHATTSVKPDVKVEDFHVYKPDYSLENSNQAA